MIRLLTLLVRYSPSLVVASLMAGILTGAANAAILAMINTALHAGPQTFSSRLVVGFLALCILTPAAALLSSLILVWLGQQAVLDMRVKLSRQILQSPLRRLEEVGAPQLFVVLTRDLASVVGALVQVPNLVTNGTIVLGCLVYLGWLSWPVLVLSIALLAAAILLYQIPVNRGRIYHDRAREGAGKLWKLFEGVTSGLKELKLHSRRQDRFLEHMVEVGTSIRRDQVAAAAIFDTAASVGQLGVFMSVGIVVIGLPMFFPVDPKTLTGFALLLLYMITPLQVILNSMGTLTSASVAIRKTEAMGLKLIQRSDELGDGGSPEAVDVQPRWDRLELNGAVHSYTAEDGEGFTLGPIDLSIRAGELVFLVGGNGSGKTTLAKMITGLYAPEQGVIRLDGQEIDSRRQTAYMQNFSALFSDFYLFGELIGLESPSLDERANRFLEEFRISDKVRVDDGKLSTTALSQGQRKRLALLTAYLEDRPIYLFDEWAADQDPYFRELFYRQLLPDLKQRGKTLIVISHDDRYFGIADRILKLDEGKLTYNGPPAGLRYGNVTVPVLAPDALAAGMPGD